MPEMTKETLRTCLRNTPLLAAIGQKHNIDDIRKKLHEAANLMQDIGISEAAQAEVRAKVAEYQQISKAYGRLLGDAWAITWQMESIIRKYADCSDDEIERLPDTLSI